MHKTRLSYTLEAPSDFPLTAPWISKELPVGLTFLDENLAIIHSNPAMMQLVGLEGETLTGREIFPLLGLSAQDQATLEAAFRKALTTKESQEFFSIKTLARENAVRYLGVRMVPLPADREAARGLLLVDDVTELEILKQRLHLLGIAGERSGDETAIGNNRFKAQIERRQFIQSGVFQVLADIGGGGELALGQPIDAVVLDDVDHVDVAAQHMLELSKADRAGVAVAADADADQIFVDGCRAGGE